MTDPRHDYESQEAAKLRLGGKLREECRCDDCRAASVGTGVDAKMLVPAMRTLPDERRVYTGRWLHGFELRRHLADRKVMLDRFKEFVGKELAEVVQR